MSLIDVLFPLINPKLLDNFGGEIPYHSTKTNREVWQLSTQAPKETKRQFDVAFHPS
jgi:hypothetical protein